MAVAENAGSIISSSDSNARDDLEKSKPVNDSNEDQFLGQEKGTEDVIRASMSGGKGNEPKGFDTVGVKDFEAVANHQKSNGLLKAENKSDGFKNDMRDLVEMLSKLNPMAKEFVPPSLAKQHGFFSNGVGYPTNFVLQNSPVNPDRNGGGRVRRVRP